MALDRFDTEETTRPDLSAEGVRGRRASSDEPWEVVGNLLSEMVQVQNQLKEWRETAGTLNARLSRIEKLLYGGAASFLLAVAEHFASRFGLLPP